MNDEMLLYKFFKLKGMIETLSDIAEQEEGYNYSIIERLQDTAEEMAGIIEKRA